MLTQWQNLVVCTSLQRWRTSYYLAGWPHHWTNMVNILKQTCKIKKNGTKLKRKHIGHKYRYFSSDRPSWPWTPGRHLICDQPVPTNSSSQTLCTILWVIRGVIIHKAVGRPPNHQYLKLAILSNRGHLTCEHSNSSYKERDDHSSNTLPPCKSRGPFCQD